MTSNSAAGVAELWTLMSKKAEVALRHNVGDAFVSFADGADAISAKPRVTANCAACDVKYDEKVS